MSADLVRSLGQDLTTQQSSVSTLDKYYSGTQPLGWLHPQVRAATAGRLGNLNVNWLRKAVAAVEQRLDVEGFRLSGDDTPISDLWRWWQANNLDEESGLAHIDSLVHGTAFVLVWYGEDESVPSITVESAREVAVSFVPGRRREVASALKQWREGDALMSTLYLPDRVERYTEARSGIELLEVIPHELGRVPVVPLVNQPRSGLVNGESDLTDLIPIVDAIGKLGTDLMVSAEYHAMPRRWATGLELAQGDAQDERTRELVRQRWQEAEAGRVWIAPSDRVNFGQFSEASLDNFISAIKMLTEQLAALADLPPHAVGVNTANPASADAIRSSESGLVQKVRRKQRAFGGAWEDVMRLASLVVNGTVDPEMVALETIWRDPETPTVAQAADAAVKLVQAGIITSDQALEDLGYSPVQIDRERARRDRAALGVVSVQLAEAERLQREQNLSQPAAFAAVGLLQAAAQISADRT